MTTYRESPQLAGDKYSRYDKDTKLEWYVTNKGTVVYNRQTHTVIDACIGLGIYQEERYDLKICKDEFQLAKVDMYGISQAEYNSPRFPYKNGVSRLGASLAIQVLLNGNSYSLATKLAVREALGILGKDNRLTDKLFESFRNPIVKEQ